MVRKKAMEVLRLSGEETSWMMGYSCDHASNETKKEITSQGIKIRPNKVETYSEDKEGIHN
jgi:hypothetical protein